MQESAASIVRQGMGGINGFVPQFQGHAGPVSNVTGANNSNTNNAAANFSNVSVVYVSRAYNHIAYAQQLPTQTVHFFQHYNLVQPQVVQDPPSALVPSLPVPSAPPDPNDAPTSHDAYNAPGQQAKRQFPRLLGPQGNQIADVMSRNTNTMVENHNGRTRSNAWEPTLSQVVDLKIKQAVKETLNIPGLGSFTEREKARIPNRMTREQLREFRAAKGNGSAQIELLLRVRDECVGKDMEKAVSAHLSGLPVDDARTVTRIMLQNENLSIPLKNAVRENDKQAIETLLRGWIDLQTGLAPSAPPQVEER